MLESGGRKPEIEAAQGKETMRNWRGSKARIGQWGILFILLSGTIPVTLAQQSAPAAPPPQGGRVASSTTHITPEQAKELFALVDELIQFSSSETGLPVQDTVKRQITSRAAVESYLDEKFKEDESAKRLQRDEIVLKKFGLLDHDFELRPFLLALLKEQIEAYYDSKAKTVNLLDWVDPEEQKPVMAHELTHALQDQHCNLEKWDDQTPDDVSQNAAGDTDHLMRDEMDTARDAVAEGQATAVMMDYVLKPMGKSIVSDPEVLEIMKSQMNSTEDSPVMARAPLLLSESMLFPYREGLSFEQDVWMDKGQAAAFTGALDRPPTSSWEILNPRMYEQKRIPSIPLLPDIHPIVDPLYRPYDIGQIGELDVHIISELFGGENTARDLTPAWDGGLYWAGQLRSAKTAAELADTKSIGLFYLSVWKNEDSAQLFSKIYARNLARKYATVESQVAAGNAGADDRGSIEQVYKTNEGPVVITRRGKLVFVAESFPLPVARRLTSLILDAQGNGNDRLVAAPSPDEIISARDAAHEPAQPASLTGSLVRFFQNAGAMKFAVDASLKLREKAEAQATFLPDSVSK